MGFLAAIREGNDCLDLDRACSMNQDLAQVRVAALADSIQSRIATGRMLLRQQPHPGRELSSLAEGCARCRSKLRSRLRLAVRYQESAAVSDTLHRSKRSVPLR